MKDKKIIKGLAIALLQLLGFPLLLVLIVINIKPLLEQASDYGVFVYAGIIIPSLIALIYFLAFFKKRRKKKQSPIRQSVGLAVFSFCCLFGLFLVIDVVAPQPLLKATQGTVYHEDLVDFKGLGKKFKEAQDTFIQRNVDNGNLVHSRIVDKNGVVQTKVKEDNISFGQYMRKKAPYSFEDGSLFGGRKLDEKSKPEDFAKYKKHNDAVTEKRKEMLAGFSKDLKAKGMKVSATKALYDVIFKSIDQNGYGKFETSWVDMANDGRLTMPVLFHLLFDERERVIVDFLRVKVVGPNTDDIEWNTDPVNWVILDMLGDPMDMDLSGTVKGELYNVLKSTEVIHKDLFNVISEFLAKNDVLGGPINIAVELKDGKTTLKLLPAAIERGSLGYQNMAWMNSMSLLYMLCSVFSVRTYFLIFGAIIPVLCLATGAIQQSNLRTEKVLAVMNLDKNDVLSDKESNKVLEDNMHKDEINETNDDTILETSDDEEDLTKAEDSDDNIENINEDEASINDIEEDVAEEESIETENENLEE